MPMPTLVTDVLQPEVIGGMGPTLAGLAADCAVLVGDADEVWRKLLHFFGNFLLCKRCIMDYMSLGVLFI